MYVSYNTKYANETSKFQSSSLPKFFLFSFFFHDTLSRQEITGSRKQSGFCPTLRNIHSSGHLASSLSTSINNFVTCGYGKIRKWNACIISAQADGTVKNKGIGLPEACLSKYLTRIWLETWNNNYTIIINCMIFILRISSERTLALGGTCKIQWKKTLTRERNSRIH